MKQLVFAALSAGLLGVSTVHRVVAHNPESGCRPRSEVFVPVRDRTQTSNTAAIVSGLAQVFASLVAIVVALRRWVPAPRGLNKIHSRGI